MMFYACSFIEPRRVLMDEKTLNNSFNGLKFHTIYKHYTHTYTKHKVGAQNFSNCFQNVSEKKKALEASLKWFSPKVKRAIKCIPEQKGKTT
jgi:hypothetical protein